MASDLPYTLRQGALAISDEYPYAWIRDALREAADALEAFEAADHELLDLRGLEFREVHRDDSVIITGAEYLRKSRLADATADRDRFEHEAMTAEGLRYEAVLVAADRLYEAYEAMLDGRDLGKLPDWTGVRAVTATERTRDGS